MGLKKADSASIMRTPVGELIWHASSPLKTTRWRAVKFPSVFEPFVALALSRRDQVEKINSLFSVLSERLALLPGLPSGRPDTACKDVGMLLETDYIQPPKPLPPIPVRSFVGRN
jgi:hypothetical protein